MTAAVAAAVMAVTSWLPVAGAAAAAGHRVAVRAPAAPAGTWGTAEEVPGTATLNTGGNGFTDSVSCASAGDCAAGGAYRDGSGEQAFVADEVNGTWGTAQQVPGTAALNTGADAQVNWLSCGSVGNCAAGGFYTAGSSLQAFVADEVNGTWGTAQQVPGTAALAAGGSAAVDWLSCASAGNCAAAGSFRDGSGNEQVFVANEVKGIWGNAQEIPGTAALNAGGSAGIGSVSCPSAGNCAVSGSYRDGSGNDQVFVANEVKGIWGNAQEIPGTAALNAGTFASAAPVSCASAGNCTTGGVYTDGSGNDQAFVADEVKGIWGNAQEIPGTAALNSGNAGTTALSCASAGNCAAGGYYRDSSGGTQVFVVDEVNGTWATAQQVPGTAALNAIDDAGVGWVSCASAGNCAATGNYADSSGHNQVFVVDEVNGAWGTAQEIPGTATLNTEGDAGVYEVSCPSAGNCAVGGFYADNSTGLQAFVANETLSTTSLTLSAPTVVYGNETSLQASVTVIPGDPAGTVTVTAAKAAKQVTACTITLAGGAGSCDLTARELAAGKYSVTAAYSGSPALAPSTSPAKTLTVAKAAATTSLTLSASTVTQQNEATEVFGVQVRPQYTGTPTGKVTVTATPVTGAPVTVCTITLAGGKGSCHLPSGALSIGNYQVAAAYGGNANFQPATSGGQTLKVTG